jgi:hypothetical protein
MLAAPVAAACSGFTPWYLYVNVVRLDGPKVEGLKWARVYNILDYEGSSRVLVSLVRQGSRIPVAKWENGQECTFGTTCQEICTPNRPREGVNLEYFFGNWTDVSDDKDRLKRLYLPLTVEVDGREIPMALRSRPVRNTTQLQLKRAGRLANNDPCWQIDETLP